MKVAFFDTHAFDRKAFEREFRGCKHELRFIESRLDPMTAELARGCEAVCCFVNDRVDEAAIEKLREAGVRLIALRSAGYNNVDLKAAERTGMTVARVPEYSPAAVAEHAVALILTLNRKIHRAHQRVRELNFSLDGLVGFDMAGKTAGLIGVGRIGKVLAKILTGFSCKVLLYDLKEDPELVQALGGGARYTSLEEVYRESDIVSLHVPLVPETRHMIDRDAIAQMKPSVLLINTGRGALIDTSALIAALKSHKIGGAGLDVYEEEGGVFFSDHSAEGIGDDVLARLLTFPNVVITSHQGFLTEEALSNIASTTRKNLDQFERGEALDCRVRA